MGFVLAGDFGDDASGCRLRVGCRCGFAEEAKKGGGVSGGEVREGGHAAFAVVDRAEDLGVGEAGADADDGGVEGGGASEVGAMAKGAGFGVERGAAGFRAIGREGGGAGGEVAA